MLAALQLTDALTTAGRTHKLGEDTDVLFWLVVLAVSLALGVIAAIAISNWRAERAIKLARANWASVGGQKRAGVDNVRPNPLTRKERR
jgi:hypothetical protein